MFIWWDSDLELGLWYKLSLASVLLESINGVTSSKHFYKWWVNNLYPFFWQHDIEKNWTLELPLCLNFIYFIQDEVLLCIWDAGCWPPNSWCFCLSLSSPGMTGVLLDLAGLPILRLKLWVLTVTYDNSCLLLKSHWTSLSFLFFKCKMNTVIKVCLDYSWELCDVAISPWPCLISSDLRS